MDWSQWDPKKMSNPNSIFDVCQSSVTSNAQVFRYSFYTNDASVNNMFTPTITWDTSTPPILQTGTCWTMPYFIDGIGLG